MKRIALLFLGTILALVATLAALVLLAPTSRVTGAVVSWVPVPPLTPAGSARVTSSCDGMAGGVLKARNFRFDGERPSPDGRKLILYRWDCAPEDTGMRGLPGPPLAPGARRVHFYGYSLIELDGPLWCPGGGSGASSDSPPDPRELVRYDHDFSRADQPQHIHGWVLSHDVAAVEVDFDSGQTLRDATRGDMFAVFGRGAAAACELRVLGVGDRVLRTIDLAPPVGPGENDILPPNRCER